MITSLARKLVYVCLEKIFKAETKQRILARFKGEIVPYIWDDSS